MIPIEKLKLVLPENIVLAMQGTLEMFSINTQLRASHFISQCAVESLNFTKTEENLNYSAVGLMNTWPKRFPDMDTAKAYAKQRQKIANHVYCNRMGNGDEASGDGWLFRGRGFIMTTGRDNYKRFFEAINEPELISNPDILSTSVKYACLSAGVFWNDNKLNTIADKGSDDAVVQEITKKINGGLNGISERIKNFKNVFKILSNTPPKTSISETISS